MEKVEYVLFGSSISTTTFDENIENIEEMDFRIS